MYDFNAVENEIIKYWETNKIYPKAKKKGEGKKKFYFLQGPPYTSGRLHMGHAWNNSLKDMVLRYKRMQGFDVWDRAGYDMHGLPTEHKVQAQFDLKTKEDIVNFGLDRFAKECIKFSSEKAKLMDADLWRLGIWMDYDNAYWPIKNEYIEGIWWLIKKAHEKKRLYEGLRTITWCASCGTALAKHECQYKEVEEPSIYVKFKIKNKKDEYFLIWTTTPWTITFNLAIMANPDLDYVKVKSGNEKWILAKGLAGPVMQAVVGIPLEIIEEFKGSKLEGMEYVHPWEDEIKDYKELKKNHPKVHTILMSSEYVSLDAGSGLVHCAPGCGPEDYEVGYKNNVPPYNNIDQYGIFPQGMGRFSGLKAKADDKKFIQALEEKGVLVAQVPVEHDYAHCERCHNPVVFRTTKQWFFKVEDLKEKMVKDNSKITWVPDAGKNAFDSWLNNIRDNSITKQRFWGTPIPIWKCDKCSNIVVVESVDELKKLKAKNIPESLHKPWIDETTIPCKCGAEMHRLPDIIDVWVDAGSASWNCLYYPKRKDLFERFFPADFILEAKEQVRGWFNLLTVASMIAFDKPCFKAVYVHGMLTDVEGEKMSKSLGNVISPYELVDKHGADTLRAYLCSARAGEDISFSWEEASHAEQEVANETYNVAQQGLASTDFKIPLSPDYNWEITQSWAEHCEICNSKGYDEIANGFYGDFCKLSHSSSDKNTGCYSACKYSWDLSSPATDLGSLLCLCGRRCEEDRRQGCFQLGQYVVIDHGNNICLRYAHSGNSITVENHRCARAEDRELAERRLSHLHFQFETATPWD